MPKYMRLGLVVILFCSLALYAQTTVPIHSQTLTHDTAIDFPNDSCQFDDGATIVTDGFALKIRCNSIAAQHVEIVSFERRAADGQNGANGGGPGGNALDGQDGATNE